MAFKYTEEQLNKLDKELLIQLFLARSSGPDGGTDKTDTGPQW